MALSISCDFDETAATANVARLLLDRFSTAGVKEVVRAHRRGETTFREYQEHAFDAVHATMAEMAEYVKQNASLRSGFRELAEACSSSGHDLKVVSAGLDFYIQALLDASDLGHIPIVAVAVRDRDAPDGPFRYDYPMSRADCDPAWGVCKCAAIDEARAAGMQTVFVGDGPRGDACAAAKADFVFARGRLLKYCRENEIAAVPFELLHPVVDFVQEHGQPLLQRGRRRYPLGAPAGSTPVQSQKRNNAGKPPK